VLPKGTTFIRNGHIWFNLTEPTAQNRFVLCVNFTCLDQECVDDECPISNQEYAWVKNNYPTTIAFSFAQIFDANKIEACLINGTLRKPDEGDVPVATVLKVTTIGRTSRELHEEKRRLL
jgi:hypothetical protein